MTARDDVLDNILLQVGGVGRYQIVVLLCLSLVVVLHSATHIAYVFTSMDSDYRCLIPECESSITSDPELLRHVVPYVPPSFKNPQKCLMYDYEEKGQQSSKNCSSIVFDKSKTVRCNNLYFYDNEHYIGREFNLLCEENLWALSLVGSVNTLGMFLGLLVTGFISDKYGRKQLLLFGMSGCGFVGLIKTLSPSFLWFLTFEFIEAILSAGSCCCVFIMAVELVVPSRRALMGSILNTMYALGEVLIAVLAWTCRDWKSLIYFSYTPCALLILLYRVLPESLRWCLSKGRVEESKQVLRDIAKANNKKLSEETLGRLEQIRDSSQPTEGFLDIMRSKCLFWRFWNCCFGWITCSFLFYGITLTSVSLYGNKYLDFILICLTELPAYWSCNFLVNTIGRRSSICASYLITVVACVCFIFTDTDSGWFSLAAYCMGKFGATAAFYVIYVIASEIFPTNLRHTVMGLCSTVGRLGSMTSPQMSILGRIWKPLPLILFAVMAGTAGILSLFFPETKGRKLPDTIKEAEEIK